MAADTNDQVLVIVSDPQAGSVIERVLSSLGVQGIICKGSEAVKETLRGMTPALLICSENVPGSNGANLSSELLHNMPTIHTFYWRMSRHRKYIRMQFETDIAIV
jgi:DNA-binding response OmpR family regulator